MIRHQRRRLRGQFYTPQALARTMIERVLAQQTDHSLSDIRILDPSCGDGSFIVAAFDLLFAKQSTRPVKHRRNATRLIQQSLFGVDLDANAIQQLRARLIEHAGVPEAERPELDTVLRTNFRCGDALTGNDLSNQPARTEVAGDAIQWSEDFPQIAASGGFDVVIGNPPYHRELNAKSLFDQVAGTDLGRRWRQARMDYWYYFLHRSLDLLKPAGRLAFVVNSYWVGSRGAQKMIQRLHDETTIERMTLLGKTNIFQNVSGQHMILQLQRGKRSADCRIVDLTNTSESNEPLRVKQTDLFLHGRLLTSGVRPQLSSARLATRLEQGFEVRQGMAENPPTVSRRHLSRLTKPVRVGDGVFVLRPQEIADLDFKTDEAEYLRPYYYPRHISRYHLPPHDGTCVLYLDGKTLGDLSGSPRIKQHLSRFRPLMEARRETRLGRIPWWQLHWPRRADLFVRPRILCRQMSHRPSFVYVERPTFVGFAVHIVIARPQQSPLPLPALTGILNSNLANEWFEILAKRRGAHLEISGELLRQFPLPPPDDERAASLASIVLKRQQLAVEKASTSKSIVRLESQIERQVQNWYGL
ncbi:MAG: N-6 DNA methylase [Planctomycetaceae bacterium]